jgi:hypothetical protein
MRGPGGPSRAHTSGSLTNDANGKSIDLNISGAGRLVTHADGSMTLTTYGPWLLFFPEGVIPSFSPRLLFISGQTVTELDSSGTPTAFRIIGGHPVDMCAALQ